MSSRFTDDEMKALGASVAAGLKDTLKDLVQPANRRERRPKPKAGSGRNESRYRLRHAQENPCYLCCQYGHTGRDHSLPKEWPEEVDQRWRNTRKKWNIIKEQAKDINDDEIPYTEVARLNNVSTEGWPTVTQKQGLAIVLAAASGLELWVEKGQIGTSRKPAECFTPEKYKPEQEEPEEEPVASVFTVEWKNTVDGKLCSLENNMEKLQSTQNNQLGMMQLMLKAQGVPL